jgi:tetratricopeptide (TPR) repeat protein
VARFRGDLSLATEHYQRAVDLFESIGAPFDAAIALTNLGIVARDGGRFDDARSAFGRGVQVAERIRYPYIVLGAKLNWAASEAAAARGDEAEALLSESLALVDETGLVDPDFAWPLEQLGLWQRARGATAGAQGLLQRARDMWAELRREVDVARVERQLAELQEPRPA